MHGSDAMIGLSSGVWHNAWQWCHDRIIKWGFTQCMAVMPWLKWSLTQYMAVMPWEDYQVRFYTILGGDAMTQVEFDTIRGSDAMIGLSSGVLHNTWQWCYDRIIKWSLTQYMAVMLWLDYQVEFDTIHGSDAMTGLSSAVWHNAWQWCHDRVVEWVWCSVLHAFRELSCALHIYELFMLSTTLVPDEVWGLEDSSKYHNVFCSLVTRETSCSRSWSTIRLSSVTRTDSICCNGSRPPWVW